MKFPAVTEWLRSIARIAAGRSLTAGVNLIYGRAKREPFLRVHTRSPPREDHSIDAVYTWVDDSDPLWRNKFDAYRDTNVSSTAESHSTRYHNRKELLYSLRSVAYYAPFFRRIYIVTDDQIPDWLDPNHPQVQMISHRDIFPSSDMLPTFNSHAIEANLHHIPGLAERYVYLNDDVFIGQPVSPLDFFTPDGKSIAYLSSHEVKSSISARKQSTLDLAYANNRRLLEEALDQTINFKLAHAPHSQNRDILFEMERRFAREFNETSGHRFRSPDDISVASCLFQYYAYYSGRGVTRKSNGDVRLAYINVASPFLAPVLRKILLTRQFKFFCINEPISVAVNSARFDGLVNDFLSEYYPEPCEFELSA